jgi:hypothetical protein
MQTGLNQEEEEEEQEIRKDMFEIIIDRLYRLVCFKIEYSRILKISTRLPPN